MRRMSKAPKRVRRQVSGDDDGVGRGEAAFEHPGDGKQDAARHAQGELKKGPRLRHPRMLPRGGCEGSRVPGPGSEARRLVIMRACRRDIAVAIGVVLGLLLGLGGYTFIYARGASYLTNDPERVRQLPRHAGAVRRLAALEPPLASPSATTATRRTTSSASTSTKAQQRLLALVLLHHRHASTSPSASRRATPRVTEGACRTCHADIVARDRHASRRRGEPLACVQLPSQRRTPALSMADTPRIDRTPDPATPRLVAALAAAGVTALLVNIFERKQEARNPFYRVVELTDETEDPAVWGKNFPLQYDGYRRTVDQVRTRYGGSEAVPRTPTERRPALGGRAVAARGGPAAEDACGPATRSRRTSAKSAGHAYMLDDQTFTERQQVSQAARHLHALPRRRSTCPTRSSAAAT